MSGEIPSHQPNPQEIDPNAINGATAMDVRLDTEALLNEGIRQLAGNIVKVAETDHPDAVKEYLSDMLADSENLAPAGERMAAFEFLSGEQRGEIRRGIVTSGERMLDNLGNNSARVSSQLKQTAPIVNRGISTAIETHEQEVGRHFRGNVDTRQAARGQEASERAARKGFGALTEQVEVLGRWQRAQLSEARQFDDDFRKGQTHQRALDEAGRVVSPDYEGEPKDLSRVIDEGVKKAAAAKLQLVIAAARAADKSPEDAVLELMTQDSDTATPKIIGELRDFTNQYVELTRTGFLKTERETLESERLIKIFTSRGRDGYDVRRVADAMDLYRKQKRTLEEAANGAGFAVRQSANVLDTSEQWLQRMRQRFAKSKED